MKNSSSGSTFFAVLCTFGLLVMVGMLANAATPKCIKSSCDNKRADGSNYCYLHKKHPSSSTRKSSSSKSGSSSSSGSSGTTSSSSSSTSTTNSSSTNNSSTKKKSSSKSKKSSTSSYDEGYEAISEDDDYNWDRYQTDSDYADGVDDAMDELDW